MEVGAILGGREVHLNIVEGLALAEIVIISGGEKTSTVSPDDGLQVASVNVEGHRFEPVHFVNRILPDLPLADLKWNQGEGERERKGMIKEPETPFYKETNKSKGKIENPNDPDGAELQV